jgi:hypothetical protein
MSNPTVETTAQTTPVEEPKKTKRFNLKKVAAVTAASVAGLAVAYAIGKKGKPEVAFGADEFTDVVSTLVD